MAIFSPDQDLEMQPEIPPHQIDGELKRRTLPDHILSVGEGELPSKRVRFVDCEWLVHKNELRVISHACGTDTESILRSTAYVAVSYPWLSNKWTDGTFPLSYRSFVVNGTREVNEGNEPYPIKADNGASVVGISVAVLHAICAATLQLGVRYVWIDRLCMIQDRVDDMDWQVDRMSKIYKHCNYCLILPGGLSRVVGLDEQTEWIHRVWTLQETLLPPISRCLFYWRYGEGYLSTEDPYGTGEDDSDVMLHSVNVVRDPISKGSYPVAMADLGVLLTSSSNSYALFRSPSNAGREINPCIIFSAEKEPVRALESAIYAKRTGPEAEAAIWRCVTMRTSTEAVDVVYSIMGLFDVNIPRRDKRLGLPTLLIRLCREILSRDNGRANWLCASLASPVRDRFCTMPLFPEQHSKDKIAQGSPSVNHESALGIPGVKAFKLLGPMDSAWVQGPEGTIDDDGIVTFTAPISPVKTLRCQVPLTAFPESLRKFAVDIKVERLRVGYGFERSIGTTHATVVGQTQFADSYGGYVIMLLKEGNENRWYKTGMGVIKHEAEWPSQCIRV